MTEHTLSRPNSPIALARITLLIFLTTALVACGGGGGAPAAEKATQQGKVTYDRVCATCHGRDANGIPMLGSGLRDNEQVRSQSDKQLVKFLKEGRAGSDPLNTTGVDMPPKGGDPSLTDQDLANIVAYLRTL